MSSVLTQYEVARIIGLRALQYSEGVPSTLAIRDDILKMDSVYVAALELSLGVLDVCIRRGDGTVVDVRTAIMPMCLSILLDTRDGGNRFYKNVSIRS